MFKINLKINVKLEQNCTMIIQNNYHNIGLLNTKQTLQFAMSGLL